ncbi:MAG: hypothetical protein Q3972_06045 [Corynebacterium sp.]|nr:hypothetical protein [Corynebacterium sp.]
MNEIQRSNSRTLEIFETIGDTVVAFQLAAIRFFANGNKLRKDLKARRKVEKKLAKLEAKVMREERRTEAKMRIRAAKRRRHADAIEHIKRELRQLDI